MLGAVLDMGWARRGRLRESIAAGIASGDVILTVLARQRQPAPPPSITRRRAALKIEPRRLWPLRQHKKGRLMEA